MDPNAALLRLRELAASFQVDLDQRRDPDPEALQDALNAFDALDGWLTKGGFKPNAWQGRDR